MNTDWEGICSFMGYDSVPEMLKDLYEVQGLSVQEISRRIGISAIGTRRALHRNNVKVRPQGGAQSFPKKHYWLHLCDQRWVFGNTLAKVAEVMRMNPTYVLHYKRKVKGFAVDTLATQRRQEDALLSDTTEDAAEPSFEG